jgi:hypothetical protein
MKSDEKPLQAWYCYDREDGEAFAEHWPPNPKYFPHDQTTRWYNADEADARIAELEAKLKEQSVEMGELHRFHRTGEWMADIQPDLSDPPVTRRELAAVLSASRGPWTTDSIEMLQRLERGQDARGEL